MSFDEIHKGEAAAVNVGVDLTQLTTGMLVGEAGATSDVGGGGGADAGGEREGLLAGGTVYWDDVAGAYRVKAVPVATPSGAITVTSEMSVLPGESVWVRVDNTAGTYTAEIVYDDDDTDEHTVALVPLGTVSEDGLTVSQSHVGAVVVAGLGEKATVAQGSGGDAGSITFDASGESPKVTISDGTNKIELDTAEVCSNSIAIHEIAWKDSGGVEQIAHGLLCRDIDLKHLTTMVQVQANWTETDTTSKAYIKNKPTLATVATTGDYNDLTNKPTIPTIVTPTVTYGTLTLTQDGATLGTFTANQNATIDIPAGGSGTAGVTSIKSLAGVVEVIGGSGIVVTAEGQTIKISYQAGKKDDAEADDEEDPCDHPDGDDGDGSGGVNPDGGDDGVGGGGSGGDGGVDVSADDDPHPSGGCDECS